MRWFEKAGIGVGLAMAGAVVTYAGLDRDIVDDIARMKQAWAKAANPSSEVRAAQVQTDFTSVRVTNTSGAQVALVTSDSTGDGISYIGDHFGNLRGGLLVSSAGAGRLALTNSGGVFQWYLDGNDGLFSVSGDMAETFPAAAMVPPGAVAVIDAEHRGAVMMATRAYDRRVAGVVAGANDYRPAITLRAGADGPRAALTLSGTVYCMATNSNGMIHAGDLLTSSTVPGHAMKVTDWNAAHGAVVGKAMEDLNADQGLILVLANLQ